MEQDAQNIYQKLSKVRKQVEVIQKNKSGYGYKYVSEDEIMAKISGMMDRYSLSLIPEITKESVKIVPYSTKKTKVTKSGEVYEEHVNEILVSADMVFHWVNNDNPDERISVSWFFVGHQSDASQSFGSGLTYAMRYFLLKYFNVATPDSDPDEWRAKQKEAADAEDKVIAEQIIATVDKELREYLAKNPDNADSVKKFISKYAKGGNYLSIKDPDMASKLMIGLRETYFDMQVTKPEDGEKKGKK